MPTPSGGHSGRDALEAGIVASFATIGTMAQTKPQVLDEDVKRRMRTLKQLLKNPAKFEEWANETLDMSRLRKQ